MPPFHLVIEGYVVSHLIASILLSLTAPLVAAYLQLGSLWHSYVSSRVLMEKFGTHLSRDPHTPVCIDISCKLFFKYRFLFFSPKPCPLLREDLCESLDSIYGRYMMYNHHTESLEASGRDGWTGVAFLLYSPSPPLLQGMHTISLLINCWFQTSPQNCFLPKMTPYFPIERTLSWEGAWEAELGRSLNLWHGSHC